MNLIFICGHEDEVFPTNERQAEAYRSLARRSKCEQCLSVQNYFHSPQKILSSKPFVQVEKEANIETQNRTEYDVFTQIRGQWANTGMAETSSGTSKKPSGNAVNTLSSPYGIGWKSSDD